MTHLHAWKQRNEWWPVLVILLGIGVAEPLVDWLVTWWLT